MRRRTRATLADVAAAAGVSKTTVSQLLNNKAISVTEATRKRVMAAVEELNYTPNALIKALQGRRTAVIGVVIGGPLGPADWLGRLALSLVRCCRERQYDTLFYQGIGVIGDAYELKKLTDGRCDGALVAFSRKSKKLQKLAESDMPVVQIGSTDVPSGVASVSFADMEMACEATAHLIKLGHERIGILTGPVGLWDSAAEQLEGYRRAMKEADLPYGENLICVLPDWSGKGVPTLCRRFSEAEPSPTAYVACNMLTAESFMAEMKSIGSNVPDDFSLIALDGYSPNGFITGANFCMDKLADAAAHALTEIIGGGTPGGHHHIIPGKLVYRNSTAKAN